MKRPTIYAMRCAAGFCMTGVLITVFFVLIAASNSDHYISVPEPTPWLKFVEAVGGLFFAGAAGAALSFSRTPYGWRAAIGFGLASIPSVCIAILTFSTFTAVKSDPEMIVLGALGFGASCALFGAIGGGSVKFGLTWSGAAAFGLPGIFWGALIPSVPGFSEVLIIFSAVPLALGGALFGRTFGTTEANAPPASPRPD